MRHSSGESTVSGGGPRGQVEPLAALVAVFAIATALTLYAGVVGDVLDRDESRDTVEVTLDAVAAEVTEAGVAEPQRLSRASQATPDGRELNVTLRGDGTVRQYGPTPPERAEQASRPIGVRTEPGRVGAGELRVVLWQ